MAAENLPFTLEEYADRLARTRAAMAEAGLDLLFVTEPANMAWLTGYDGWSFYVHQGVIVPMHGEPVWWGRGMDARGAVRTAYLAPENITEYPDHFVQATDCHPMSHLAELIAARGWAKGRLGVEMDNYYYTAKAHETLAANLADMRLVDATSLVAWQRAVKSPAEIGFMRKAARIVEAMHTRIYERIEPGMRKVDLVAEIFDASLRGVEGSWGDYPSIVPLTPSGLDATAAHLTWDDRPIEKGQSTFFEIAGVYRRYHTPQSRTVFLGEPPDKYRRAEEAVLVGVDAGLAMAKPGNTCHDIADAFFSALAKHGFQKDSRTGYSIGLAYPPDWGEHSMSLRRGDMTVLKPGMCLHFMPALWLDDGGLEITEPILITEEGAECFCLTERRIFVKS